MFSTTTRQAAEVEIGRRHPYLVKYGPKLLGLVAAVIVLGAIVWGVASLAGSAVPTRPDVSLPSLSLPGVPWPALVVVALLALAVAVTVWWRRGGYSVTRVGWRFYLV
jgi:uncharacterized membrane protein YdbT with pleckstrin-like domain